ncbi:MAG: DNA polymerase III subunit alpha [Actinomycetota bacterium]
MFVHLHTHSNYSLREGAAHVGDLAEHAAATGMEALALTDHDGMYGAVRFTLACNEFGVRPILGTELEWGDGYHAVLLARDARGWTNLCRLVSEMHLEGDLGEAIRAQALPPGRRPRTSFEAIAARSEGLLALSGCARGEVPWLASLGRVDEAAAAARRWLDVFGTDGFAVEVSNHMLEGDDLRNQRLAGLAADLGVRTVATNNVHYVEREDAALHDVLDCIRRIVALDRRTAPRANAEFWLKSPAEMAALHPPEAVGGTRWVAEQCSYQLPLGEFHFPDLPASRGGPDRARGESPTEILARRCWEGVRRRYPSATRVVTDRLQMELRAIRRQGFCGYFLLVADIVDHARRGLGIRCACRGSAAGSLVAFVLGISDVDPVHHDLAFERFMNVYRHEIPDIDVDVESARREEVLRYVLDTYGSRTAMVAMMETFRARAALREVGKALGLHESEIDIIAKAFPHVSAGRIGEALEALPEVAELRLDRSRLETLFELASRLDGFPRHLAMHPSGVVLSDESVADLMPMQRSFEGFVMSQFDKDDVEALGLAKLDVLGVRMLSSMTHALSEIERAHGTRPDLDAIPRDDPATFELIRDSRTIGCFQIESPGQRELLGKFQPDRFEDLIIDISLFRPGPVKSDMVRPFLERRHRFQPVTYPHPSLAPILRETNGVIVYHEQVMRVIAALTGCGLSEADKIRRRLDNTGTIPPGGMSGSPAPTKPQALPPEQQALRDSVVDRAVARGWRREVAEQIWSGVLQFASFGFCKAHAAAFAVPTYQSAWLKAHHPAELYSGLLTHDPGMYPRRAILADARAHRVPILPVDVNRSWGDYRVEPVDDPDGVPCPDGGVVLGIRLALRDVKGISLAEIDSILAGRPWRSFEEFCRRAEVDRNVTEALVHCGAFDSVKGARSRRELFWLVEQHWGRRETERSEQLSFDLAGDLAASARQARLPGIADYTASERVSAELEVLGLDASSHVLSFYEEQLRGLGWTPAAKLRTLRGGAGVVVAGVKVATQTPPVRSGRRVLFLTLEDGTGQADITFFEEAQAKYARRVFDGWILAVRGTVRRTGARGVSVLGEEVLDLRAVSGRKLWHASPGSAGR